MCFELTVPKGKSIGQPKTARKNIRVFKAVGTDGTGPYYNLTINGREERWTRGFIYEEMKPFKSAFKDGRNLWVNGDAFHSCKTKRGAGNHKGYYAEVVKMIIPKGSLYYENKTEYVSSHIHFPLEEAKKVVKTRK